MSRVARLLTFAIGVFAVIVIAGCSKMQESQIVEHIKHGLAILHHGRPLLADLHPVKGGWIIQRLAADIDGLNPVTLESADGQEISNNINEGMLHLNNYTLQLDPCLAESCDVSPDQLIYTFHLRHDVRWHDGQPFTAEDVKFTYDSIQNPKIDVPILRSYFTAVESCEILDPYTVRFTTTQKYYKMLEELGNEMKIVPKHAFDQSDPDFTKNEFSRHPIGTGPYKFLRWVTGAQIVLQRNDDYWDTAHPRYPDRLVFQVIQEPFIAAQLLKKGEIDVLDAVSPIIWKYDLDHSAAIDKCRQVIYPYPTYNFLGFNLRNPLFADVRVRHAIDLLIPRDAILQQIYLGVYGTKTSGYDLPSEKSYNPAVQPTPTDPSDALELLTEAGWKNDHGDGLLYKNRVPLSFTLLYRSGSPNEQKMVELIQESLAHCGIEVKLSRLEFAQWIQRVDDWKFEAAIGAWALDVHGDPTQLWNGPDATVKHSSNYLGYNNPEADKLMTAGRIEYNDDKRAEIYQRLHQVIHDDYPCCFLFNPQYIMLISDRFHNVKMFTPRPCFDISEWWVPKYRQRFAKYK